MSESKALGREDLLALALKPKKIQPVEIPGVGCCHIRVLSGFERDAWESGNHEWDEKSNRSRATFRNARARLLVLCLCDAQGNRLFDKEGYADHLGRMDNTILDKLYDEATALNKLTRESQEATEKNLPTAPTSDSGSELPAS